MMDSCLYIPVYTGGCLLKRKIYRSNRCNRCDIEGVRNDDQSIQCGLRTIELRGTQHTRQTVPSEDGVHVAVVVNQRKE